MAYVKQTHCKNGHEFTDENVYVATHKSDGRQYRQCRICHNADSNARYHALTPEERAARRLSFPSRAKGKHYQRKYKYGMTEAQVIDLVAYQGGGCGICGRLIDVDAGDPLSQVHIDHDHATGETRAALCRNCNAGLGMFGEDEGTLKLALAYVMMSHH